MVLSFTTFAQAQEASVSAEAPSQPPAETQEEIPAPQRSLLKTAATREFNKALYFDQLDNGVILPPLELEYDLTGANGKQLKIGNVALNEKNFFFALLPLGKTHSQINQVLSGGDAGRVMLLMAWPDKLLTHGTIEMISRTGTVLWSHTFSQEDHDKWIKQLEEWRKELIGKGVPAKQIGRSGVFGTQFGLDAKAANAPFWGQKESFRFCVSQSDGRNSTKICSQRYGTKSSGQSVVMGKMRMDPTPARVLVQNEEAPPKNSVTVGADMPTAFFAELASGESYEFVTLPNKLQLMDISDTKKANLLRIVGYDTRPIGRSVVLNPDQYSALTKLLGFEATIGDPRKFWAAAVAKNDPKIYLPGQGGGVFKQRFELSEIPRTQARVYLSKRTPTGTYIDGIKLEGRKQPVADVSSEQNSVTVNDKDPASFVWNFKATERGAINRSYLNVTMDGKTYKSFYEIYKGFPRELSGRFTGVQASGEFIIMGEVAYNQWFEDLFGWTNYWLSRQRWGFSAKYFQSFNQLKVDDAGNTAPLSVMTVDFKYRATPGLWGRDETVGGMLSYQSVTFDQLKAPMLGVGAFWARSMPKVFDDLFNLVPLLRYPKWVDMEFIYYMNSMDSNVTLNSSMSLNFHGKVLWSDRYFGEAGFGMKRYGFTDSSVNQKAELNTFYGTVGLGINF
ncbi:MAG: hypothetical protein OM95_10585 [Bdellovibrio sp. ArHS]|nr:MAG: hypothetical protein OM95_10585 [Bdellovibrio sp. ArHS]